MSIIVFQFFSSLGLGGGPFTPCNAIYSFTKYCLAILWFLDVLPPLSSEKWRHLAFEGAFQIQGPIINGFFSLPFASPPATHPLLYNILFFLHVGTILISIRICLFVTHLKKQMKGNDAEKNALVPKMLAHWDSEKQMKRNFLNLK